ncbi:MAG: SusC/RagA family TonB-linked outer membrane protein [Mediterranea sp.]|nr:SusC/RagA family TonB-linked outer membrane protein [Mediterranea sp.]
MKKVISFCFLLALCAVLRAQTGISGTVTDAATNEPVTGVNVVEAGTSNGVITDLDGKFTLTLSNPKAGITLSMVGYKTLDVERPRMTDTYRIEEDVREIEGVVVTALHIPKQKKMLGYAVQEVKGNDISVSRDANPISALVGKVAGMRVNTGADLLSSPAVQIRGVAPVYVIDGVPVKDNTWSFSPDDIESVTVLKGPTAAALYGSEGKNGAIQITTRRGTSGNRNFSVDVRSTTQLQTSFIAKPGVQYAYGSGSNFIYDFGDGLKGDINGKYNRDTDVWGPRFEGQLIKQYNSPMDAGGVRTPTPWVASGENNLERFVQTGLVTTNNIAIAQRSDAGDFRVSVSDTYQKGILPNTKLNSFNTNFSGSMNLSEQVKLSGAMNFNRLASPNYPETYYNPRSPIYLLSIWTGANIDISDLRDYWVPGMEGVQQFSYDYLQYNNPWFMAYENTREHVEDNINGQLALTWRITPEWDVRVRTNLNTNAKFKAEKFPVNTSYYEDDYGTKKWVGGYDELYERYTDWNSDFMLNYAHQFNRSFGIKATFGGAYRIKAYKSSYTTTHGGLIVPDIYTFQNAVEGLKGKTEKWDKEVGSLYANIDLDYNNYLFLNLTGRTDKSSTLPIDNNTYFYPSVSLSGVLSDMADLSEVFSYLRVRASYARVGGDLDPYQLRSAYITGDLWNGQTPLYTSSELKSADIKPEFSSSAEVGIDMRFFKNRLGFDFSYFQANDGPQIFSLSTSSSSGYDTRLVNGLTYKRRGTELTVTAIPVQKQGFSWNVSGNISKSHRYLEKIYGDIPNYEFIRKGERADQIWEQDFMRAPDGKVIYSDGLPVRDPIKKHIGNYDPDFIFGLHNEFKTGNVTLSFSLDGNTGGKIYNEIVMNLWKSGRHEDSDNEWRLADWEAYKANPAGYGITYKGTFVAPGVVVTGGELVRDADGNVLSDTRTFAPNTTPVLYQTWAGGSNGYYRTGSQTYQSRTYVKLRDVTVTYNLPRPLLKRVGLLRSASVSLVGRNLLYFSGADYLDLDQFSGSTSVLQTPSTRNFGININATF